jgi:glycerophosphoryl diester phosphodiesterase
MTADRTSQPCTVASACGAALWPANTVEAALKCLDVAVDAIEIDVQLTCDDVVIAHHDFRLSPDRTRRDGIWLMEASPPIATLSYSEIRAYDVGGLRPGSDLASSYPLRAQWDGVRVPTMAAIHDAMAERAERTRTLIVEIKTTPQDPAESPDLERLVRSVVAELQEMAVPHVVPRIIAFDWAVLRLVKAIAPEIATGHLVIPQVLEHEVRRDARGWSPWTDGCDPMLFDASLGRAVAAHGGSQLSVYFRDISAALIDDAAAQGLTVAAWGLAEPGDIAAMRAIQLDSLTVSGPHWG